MKRIILSLALALCSACQPGQALPPTGSTAAGSPAPLSTVSSSGDRPASAEPLAEATPSIAGLGIRLMSLRRIAPNVVELRLELRNTTAVLVDLTPLSSAGPWLAESSVATSDGQRRFFVLRDSSGRLSASDLPTALEPGQTLTTVVRFGAVPADVGTLEFVAPHIEPVRGLSLQP